MKPISAANLKMPDDEAILRMAADDSTPLLHVIERSSALRPLVIVLAVLPSLMALEHRDFGDDSALWSLRALDVINADSFHDVINPGRSVELTSQPVLTTWLTALVFQTAGTTQVSVALIVSLLAGAGCVWWGFRLFSHLGGTRIGFLATVLFATHAGVLLSATSASPSIVAIFFVLITCEAWFRHIQDDEAQVGPWLMLSGVTAGFTLLCGGPLFFAILAVLAMTEVITRFQRRMDKQRVVASARMSSWTRIVTALAAIGLTAFALGGWWLLQAASTNGSFWSEWLSGYDAAVFRNSSGASSTVLGGRTARDIVIHFLNVIGPMLPLPLLGFVCSAKYLVLARDQQKRALHALMISWLLVGTFYVLMSPAADGIRTLADLFFLIRIVGLAAIGLEEILKRRIPLVLVSFLALSSFVLTPIRLILKDAGPYFLWSHFLWFLTAFFCYLSLLWGLQIWTTNQETRRRRLTIALMTGQVFIVCLAGIFGLPPSRSDERRLSALREEIQRQDGIQSVEKILLISNQTPSASLVFAIRSLRKNAEWHEFAGWDELDSDEWRKLTKHNESILVVEWATKGSLQSPSSIVSFQNLISVASPRFYRDHELRVFLVRPETGPLLRPER